MADLIDREALVEQLELLARYEDPFRQSVISGVVYTIKRAPAVDAVEVVRCKDCKHWEAHCNGKAGICPKRKGVARADDFCSYGERREENAAD